MPAGPDWAMSVARFSAAGASSALPQPFVEGLHGDIYGGQHRFRENLTATLGSTIIVPQSAICRNGEQCLPACSSPLKQVEHREGLLIWAS